MTSTPTDALDPQEIRALQLLQGTLTTAPVLFLIVIIALPTGTPKGHGALEQLRTLSAAHVFTALGCLAAALVLPAKTQARILSEGGALLPAVRKGLVLRMALLEGAALFGGTVILEANKAGVLPDQPLLWVNSGSTVVLVAFSLFTFPTQRRLEQAGRDRTSAS